jgi:hypothetical protein
VDAAVIIEHYNRYRRTQRYTQSSRILQTHNSLPPRGPINQPEAVEPAERTDGSTNIGSHTSNVGLSLRMHLDTGLVRSIIREVTRTDPYGNYFVGFCLIDRRNRARPRAGPGGDRIVDNGMVTSLLLTSAMESIVHDWYTRFGVPLPYHSHVDAAVVRHAIHGLGPGRPAVRVVLPPGHRLPVREEGGGVRRHPRATARQPAPLPLQQPVHAERGRGGTGGRLPLPRPSLPGTGGAARGN